MPQTQAALTQLTAWFTARGWQTAEFQRQIWQHWLAGNSLLLHAPTGSGKTLAAIGGPLLERLANPAMKTTLLWLTPMRALAADTRLSIEQVCQQLGLHLRIELRTSDTTSSQRAKQKKQLPDVLITTPESLSLLLSYASSTAQLANLQGVVVDEWHELLGSKRGVQLELCLARLRLLNQDLRVLGLSATLGNLEQAQQILMGSSSLKIGAAKSMVVHATSNKLIEIDTLLPDSLERFPKAGHMGLQQLEKVVQAIFQAKSTLLFTNTRAQAELWHRALAAVIPNAEQILGLHHGSLDRDVRAGVEAGLKSGALRCVVATSSLDLGVDFSDVEQSIQLGSPKGIARLLQRAGRSGHAPGQVSKLKFIPTHAFELLEIYAARVAVQCKIVEQRSPPMLALDVLAQHLVTIALGTGFAENAMFEEVCSAYSFAQLERASFDRILSFIQFGGDALANYPEFQRVSADADGWFTVPSKSIAQRHRYGIGTIVANGAVQVRMQGGANVGVIEESFITRLNPGDQFVFSGRVLQLKRIHELVAFVVPAKSQNATVPRWSGGKLALSTELAGVMRETLDQMVRMPQTISAENVQLQYGPEVALLAPSLRAQAEQSALPKLGELLIERLQSKEGWHLFVYPFGGRQVNEGMAALIAHRASQIKRNSFSFAVNDYGFELLAETAFDCSQAALTKLLNPTNLIADLLAAINSGELARRHFREIARVSGLLLQAPPGKVKSTRQLQASAGLLFNALTQHDAGHILLEQTHRDVLEVQLGARQLQIALDQIAGQTLRIIDSKRLSPMAFPLWAERLRESMSNETASERIARMAEVLEAS